MQQLEKEFDDNSGDSSDEKTSPKQKRTVVEVTKESAEKEKEKGETQQQQQQQEEDEENDRYDINQTHRKSVMTFTFKPQRGKSSKASTLQGTESESFQQSGLPDSILNATLSHQEGETHQDWKKSTLRVVDDVQQQNLILFEKKIQIACKNSQFTFQQALVTLVQGFIVYVSAKNNIVVVDGRNGQVVQECKFFNEQGRSIGILQSISDTLVVAAGRGRAVILQILSAQEVQTVATIRFKKEAFAIAYETKSRVLVIAGRDFSKLKILGVSGTRRRTINIYQGNAEGAKWSKRLELQVQAEKREAIVTHIAWAENSGLENVQEQGDESYNNTLTLAVIVQSEVICQFFLFDIDRDLKHYELQHVVDMQQYSIGRVFHLSYNVFLRKWLIARERGLQKNNCFFALDPQRDSRVVRCEEFHVNDERTLGKLIHSARAPRRLLLELGEGTALGVYDLLEEQLIDELTLPPHAPFQHVLPISDLAYFLLLADNYEVRVVVVSAFQ